MSYACLILPYPPSLNHAWRYTTRGVLKSKGYRSWITEAGYALNHQKPLPTFSGAVEVTITVGKKKGRRDIDNLPKAILDLMKAHGILVDDEQVTRLVAQWGDVTGARVELEAA